MCRFYVTADIFNLTDPARAKDMLDQHVAEPTLEATLTRGQDWSTYTFPDDSVLVMIGTTPNLLTRCAEARQAGVDWITTSGGKPLVLRFVRMKVGLGTTKTLIVVGADTLVRPNFIRGGWMEYTNLIDWNDKLSMEPAGGVPRELPGAIRWIKENHGDAWV
jgi:hypothetical protein